MFDAATASARRCSARVSVASSTVTVVASSRRRATGATARPGDGDDGRQRRPGGTHRRAAAISGSISAPARPAGWISRANRATTSPRSRNAPTASWYWAAPTAPSTRWALPARQRRPSAAETRSCARGFHCNTGKYDSSSGPRADLDHNDRRRRSREQALRAGQGATTLAADPLGVVLVADTRGGQLLVYGVDPLILRQAYPVRQAPYGLAGSRELAWVSQPRRTSSLVTICQPEFPSKGRATQPCSNPTPWPLMKRRTPYMWCRGRVRVSRSSSTRRARIERRGRAAAESAARGLGH